MVRIPLFDCHGLGSGPGQGTEVLQAARFGQEKKKRERINATLHIQQLAFPEGRSSQSWLSIGTTWELSAILLPGFHPRPISQSLQGWILNISFFFFFFYKAP